MEEIDERKMWEEYSRGIYKIKVEGGHIYGIFDSDGNSMVFVPDIDLNRYQAHLRDAYKQGYADGRQDAFHGVDKEFAPL
jgi:hypothetical protein